jgi:hypothetical protein
LFDETAVRDAGEQSGYVELLPVQPFSLAIKHMLMSGLSAVKARRALRPHAPIASSGKMLR